MEDKPLVSVVIATYNMGQYLADAIRSVLDQTRPNLELLVIDDGSTDNTRDVVAGFEADARLRYRRQPNSGQARAKNVGIALARGRFIAFCDADDLWTTDKLERQLHAFDDAGRVAVVYGRNRKIAADGSPLAHADESNAPAFWPGYTAAIHRELRVVRHGDHTPQLS